jgi:hypothetical protein
MLQRAIEQTIVNESFMEQNKNLIFFAPKDMKHKDFIDFAPEKAIPGLQFSVGRG